MVDQVEKWYGMGQGHGDHGNKNLPNYSIFLGYIPAKSRRCTLMVRIEHA
jgi:hypothetical protein